MEVSRSLAFSRSASLTDCGLSSECVRTAPFGCLVEGRSTPHRTRSVSTRSLTGYTHSSVKTVPTETWGFITAWALRETHA
ncbi:MAG: hypothetical protein M3170_05390 [Candidatus Dormibacteraeota bacterium]|nr:hypothetical protein [Candidatus Dormibacteraeota bacterium]